MMATDKVMKVDELSAEERAIVVESLQVMHASVKRSITTEKNEKVKDLRKAELDAIVALQVRFSK